MRIDRFLGIAPAIAPMHLPTAFAQDAVNCYMDKGYAITPMRAPEHLGAILYNLDGSRFTGKAKTIWKSGDVWVAWDHWVEVCKDPREWSSVNSFLFVDDGKLWRSSDVYITQGIAPKRVGIARPGVFLSASVVKNDRTWTVDPGDGLNCNTTSSICNEEENPPEPRSYQMTVVNDMEEESPPCNASDVIMVPHNGTVLVAVTNETKDKIPDSAVKYRWYRTLSNGEQANEWLFVRETSVPYLIDNYDALQLGDPLVSLLNYPAEDNIAGVASLGHANVVVWNKEGYIYTSRNRLPHAFPLSSKKKIDYPIVTMRSSTHLYEGNISTQEMAESKYLYVLTEGHPYVGMYVPDEMDEDHLTLRQLAVDEPCLSPWGATVGEGDCFYASERGIVRLGSNSVDSILDKEFSHEYWTRWQPHTMKLGYERGVLFGFQNVGGWVLPISTYLQDRQPILSRTSINAEAIYCAPDTRMVIAQDGGSLLRWRGSSTTMVATWWSAEWQMPEYWNPGAIKIDADIHSLRSSHSDKAWYLYKNYVAKNGACSGKNFWDEHPEFLDCKGFINYMLNPIRVEIYREGKLYARKEVVSERPIRLPRQGKGIYWSVKIITPIPVFRVMIDKAIRDMASPIDPNSEG